MILQVLSGKEPWWEIRGDAAVLLRLAKGHKPGRPESRIMDDSHWNLIQNCWSPVEERNSAEVIIPTIQQFLSYCPQSPPLCDLLRSSWSGQADLGAAAPTESSSTHSYQSAVMSSITPQQSDDNRPEPHLVILAHDDLIWMLAYFPDGRRVVTSSGDGTMKLWNLKDREQEGTSMGPESKVRGLAVTQNGMNIVSGEENGKIKVWNVESHEIVTEWTHPGSFPEIAISPDDRLIAVGDQAVAIYTLEGRQVNYSIEVGGAVLSMCFSPDGKTLACSTCDDIRVYDVDSGTLILGPLEGHRDWVLDVLWSRDGSRLFSASTDETIRCWNSDTGEQIGHPWTGHTDRIRSLSLSPDGSILASASWDKTVRFWNTTTGNPIGQQIQHDKQVYVVRFSPSGEFVASAGSDGKIYLWRVPSLDSVESVRHACMF